jgi:flagellar M-ring protein FliF
VRVQRAATGAVKRLNAAVVVNHRVNVDAKGKTTSTPLSADELGKIESLVREAIGFIKDRGDSVKVVNAPFRVEKIEEPPALPLWRQPQVLDVVRAVAVPGSLALLALVVLFTLIRPALKSALTPPPAPVGKNVDTLLADETAMPGLASPQAAPALEAPKAQQLLDSARGMAKENPAAVANIVKGWVSGEAA